MYIEFKKWMNKTIPQNYFNIEKSGLYTSLNTTFINSCHKNVVFKKNAEILFKNAKFKEN